MGIGADLDNFITIICLPSVHGCMIFDLGT